MTRWSADLHSFPWSAAIVPGLHAHLLNVGSQWLLRKKKSDDCMAVHLEIDSKIITLAQKYINIKKSPILF